jgi:hypothetical protein
MKRARVQRTALGWSVHTGWAVLVAVSGSGAAAAVVDRRRVQMMPQRDVKRPRFVYHAAQLKPADGARLVREATEMSWTNAKAAIEAAADELRARGYDVVASGIIVGNKRLEAPLATIIESHALIHTAEGQLFRDAVRRASESAKLSVVEIGAKEVEARAARTLKLSEAALAARLTAIGGAAGRPWSKDHRQACLAALIALN